MRETGRSKSEKTMWQQQKQQKDMTNGSRGQRFRETFLNDTLLALKMEQRTTNRGKQVASGT